MKFPTKKELKQMAAWNEYCDKLSIDLDKIFTKWDDLNNKGQKWENSLGPRSKIIRKNLFGAGFYEAEKYWKLKLKEENKKIKEENKVIADY